MIVHLVRHGTHAEVGAVLSGRSEIALSEGGRGEAEALAAAFSGAPVARLHVSPRMRTRETAAPLAGMLGLRVKVADALDEIDFGGFAGRSFDALDGDADWHRWNAQRSSARCPGGETMEEAVVRAAAFLTSLSGDGASLCVTHCDIIRGLVCRTLDLPYERMFAIDCDPASVTTLELQPRGMRLVQLNARGPR